jgi:hypothetical protein
MDEKYIQPKSLLELIDDIHRRAKQYQAVLLTTLELELGEGSPKFKALRKAVLDNFNDYTRDVIREIFGDIETN